MTATTCNTTSTRDNNSNNNTIPLDTCNNKETLLSSSSDGPTAVAPVVVADPCNSVVVVENININNMTPTPTTAQSIIVNNNTSTSPSSQQEEEEQKRQSLSNISTSSLPSPSSPGNNNNNDDKDVVVTINTNSTNDNTTTNSSIINNTTTNNKDDKSSSTWSQNHHKRQTTTTSPQKQSKRDNNGRRKKRCRQNGGGGTVGITPDDQQSSSIFIRLLTDIIPNYTLRVIEPYPFTFATFVKKRWVGRTILDVYHDEFGSFPRSYYEAAITEGRILVSSHPVPPTYILHQHDKLTHTVHRHEPAVCLPSPPPPPPPPSDGIISKQQQQQQPPPLIPLLYETPTLLVVNKPCTIPIHPCGGYNFNSLFYILQNDYPRFENSLYTIHRLDRLTSGVTVIAKSKSVAKVMGDCLMDRVGCEKVYLARVRGKFPLGAVGVVPEWTNGDKLPSLGEGDDGGGGAVVGYWMGDESGSRRSNVSFATFAESRTSLSHFTQSFHHHHDATSSSSSPPLWLHLACPTRITNPKVGQCLAAPLHLLNPTSCPLISRTIKPAQTSFCILHYDARTDTTIVAAKPWTGRTHQIRVHLKYLGHVIGNDVSYGGDLSLGEDDDEPAKKRREEARVEMRGMEGGCEMMSCDTPATEEEVRRCLPKEEEEEEESYYKRGEGESLESFLKKTCVWCRRSRTRDGGDGDGDGVTRRCVCEFLVRSSGIWLHALRYSFRVPKSMVDEGGEEEEEEEKEEGGETKKRMVFVTDPPEWSVFSDEKGE